MSDQEPQDDHHDALHTLPIAAIFAWELVIFITGLLAGFFWHLYYTVSKDDPQVHIIIGLCVVIACLWRYLALFRRRYAKGRDAE